MDNSHQPSERTSDSAERAGLTPLSPREAEMASLKLLRDYVAKAVEEIVRLRAQNKSLVRRLAEFETSGASPVSAFDDGTDVDEIKLRIASFISSIDTYVSEHEA